MELEAVQAAGVVLNIQSSGASDSNEYSTLRSELSSTIDNNALGHSTEVSSSVHDESLVANEYVRLTLLRRFKVEARRARRAYCAELKAEWDSDHVLGKENRSPAGFASLGVR
jgi:hypothetical protein